MYGKPQGTIQLQSAKDLTRLAFRTKHKKHEQIVAKSWVNISQLNKVKQAT